MGLFDVKQQVKDVASRVVGNDAVSSSFRASKIQPPLPAALVDFVSINKAQDLESGDVIGRTYVFNIELLTSNTNVSVEEQEQSIDVLFAAFETALDEEFGEGFDIADFWPHDVLWGKTTGFCGSFQLTITV